MSGQDGNATEAKTGEPADVSGDVNLYSSSEDRIKFLGEALGNDISRRMLLMLSKSEMTAYEVARDAGLSLSLVAHHLKKMQSAGLVRVSRMSKNSKNRDMKHYRAVSIIMVVPEGAYAKSKSSKLLSLSLRKIMRFAAIGIAGLSSWLVATQANVADDVWHLAEDGQFVPAVADPLAPVAVGLGVIAAGLVLERILAAFNK
ncbi:MAG: winged helix-turn-helix domain-containing protein [Thaumarchaeota archaeon]|nr:winged helix-turn-helix domain-containing protein [Nitrososphaerota archaeon]